MNNRIPWRRVALIMTALIFALGLLAACGRNKEEETAPEPVTAAEPAQPTAAAEEPTAEEAPTEAPTAEEAPAAEEAPTEAAAAEEPAAEEPAADAATAQETPAQVPAAPSDSAVVQGACYQPYYPIRDGAVYHYRITTQGSDPVEMSTQYKVTGPDTFVTIQSFNDMSTEMSWRCTDEGLLNTDFGMNGMDIPGVDYTLENVSGTTVPLPDMLQPGNQWQSEFAMSGGMSAEGMEIKMDISATMDNTMVDFEDVTVPAGTYNAAKIDTTTTVDMQMDMGDMGSAAIPGMDGITTDSSMWLVDGVGMVKTTSGDGDFSSVTELISIE